MYVGSDYDAPWNLSWVKNIARTVRVRTVDPYILSKLAENYTAVVILMHLANSAVYIMVLLIYK